MKAWLKENWSTLVYGAIGVLVVYYLREIAEALNGIAGEVAHLKP